MSVEVMSSTAPAQESGDADFRVYNESNSRFSIVQQCYHDMHTYQCYDFVMGKKREWCQFNHAELTMMEALEQLNNYVDASDPDLNLPNSVHAYQTAERIREKYPDNEWFQVVGLIHDCGKMLNLWGEPQWCTTGDTFPVGCAFSEKIVFGIESFEKNPDIKHPVYSTRLGMYEEHCGLENVHLAWGHDEYLYQVLKNHPGCQIPEKGLRMIRYHSFYPWHSQGEYSYLCTEEDHQTLQDVLEFNQFDLYSKSEKVPDMKELEKYYTRLMEKYVPGVLKW